MPELPEVETVRRGLSTLLVGHTIKKVMHDTPKSFPNAAADVGQSLVGARVADVRRRAKMLLIDLSSGYSLVIHLKMTGQLVYVRDAQMLNPKDLNPKQIINPNDQNSKQTSPSRHSRPPQRRNPVQSLEQSELASSLEFRNSDLGFAKSGETRFGAGHPNDSLVGRLPDRSTRVILELDKDAKLFFNDQRKFGWIKLYPTIEVPNIDFMKKVGPEPLEKSFSLSVFRHQLEKRNNSIIKAVLLDQTVIAGVGNIYADESLWGARIHPLTKVSDIPTSKIKNLYSELLAVLKLSIEKGGSTDKNYVNAEGQKGSYISFARVFRKEGTPCQRHPNTLIEKIKVAGRGTHICPKCQTLEA